jgi:hypothetical protein
MLEDTALLRKTTREALLTGTENTRAMPTHEIREKKLQSRVEQRMKNLLQLKNSISLNP